MGRCRAGAEWGTRRQGQRRGVLWLRARWHYTRVCGTVESLLVGLLPLTIKRSSDNMNVIRRSLATAAPSLTDVSITQIPEAIFSRQLPKSLLKYVRDKLHSRGADPLGDPSVPQIAAPSSTSASAGRTQVFIPNPFLLQKIPFLFERADGTIAQMNRYKMFFTKREQKKFLALHDRYHLPPSSINPIPSVPKVIWEQPGEHFGKEIIWRGDWAEEKTKGVYAGRKLMFKGHKRERERPEKRVVTEERIEDMPRRVEEWRTVSRLVLL